jgi:hypothetical protein
MAKHDTWTDKDNERIKDYVAKAPSIAAAAPTATFGKRR